MKVLVTGCGRGGTNLGIEVVRCLKIPTTRAVEDRTFFERELPDKYATKLATENKGFTKEALKLKMQEYPDLKIIFMIRHPFDNVMSKITRGQPRSMGGDNSTEEVMPDGTLEGATAALKYMYDILDFLQCDNELSSRIKIVKMEDLISNPVMMVDSIARFLGATPTKNSYDFYKYNRNAHQKSRYGNSLAPQVDLYKDVKKNFSGFFVGKEEIVLSIK